MVKGGLSSITQELKTFEVLFLKAADDFKHPIGMGCILTANR